MYVLTIYTLDPELNIQQQVLASDELKLKQYALEWAQIRYEWSPEQEYTHLPDPEKYEALLNWLHGFSAEEPQVELRKADVVLE